MHSSDALATLDLELCGKLADLAGARVSVSIPSRGCSADELLALAARAAPSLAGALEDARVRICVNETIVRGEAMVLPGDRVALFPPVSGG